MLFEAEFAEGRYRVSRENGFGRAVGEQRYGDGDEPADEVRVAVAAKMEDRAPLIVLARLALEPDLADAAAHLVDVVVRRFGQRLERTAELDDVAVAILPLVEEGEIVTDGVNRGQRRARELRCYDADIRLADAEANLRR